MKIGMMVYYTSEEITPDPRGGAQPYTIEYPAIVYKVHQDPQYLGLYVFTDNGCKMMRSVVQSEEKKPETWRIYI